MSGALDGIECSNYWVCTHTGPFKLEMAIQRLGWEFDLYVTTDLRTMTAIWLGLTTIHAETEKRSAYGRG